jgi:hypothetical protein
MEIELPVLSSGEKEQLASTLGVDEAGLEDAIGRHVVAAAEEYVRMFLGQRVFTRGSDIREYRLLLLIKHAFNSRIPSEAQVSRLFQTTETQSRSLIRSVMSKFQYELHQEIEATLKDLVRGASEQEDSDEYDLVVDSDNLVDELNRRIQAIDGTLPAISKRRGTASTYVLKPSAHTKLVQALQL